MSKSQRDTTEYDRRYLESGISDLESYLLSGELYWPVGVSAPAGQPPYPRLSLGNLLLSRARLNARRFHLAHTAEFERLDNRMQGIRSRWLSAWRQKAQREFSLRLNLWRDFLEDYRQSPAGNVDRYAYEINRRVILELLAPETASVAPAERELLSGLDSLLRAVFIPGPFVWDRELEGGFPADPYWYLYGLPKVED